MTNAITVRGANKHYGDFAALDNVDFDVPSGSLTALLGPSGSGKSTLLRAIAGLDQPDTGTVTINGRDVTSIPPQRRGIGFVFQHYAAFKHMNVRDNVAFGLKIRKRPKSEIKEKVDNLLEVVGLSGFQHRYPNQLSGGQRQRMALARALAVDPEVLLLDEPFGALDAKVREDLRAWLRRLHDEVHVTTVLVTHDQAEALDVSDRIAVLNKGRIEQVGSPTEVYDEPANAFVMSFLGAVASLNGALVRPHDIRVGRNPELPIADDASIQATGVVRATIDRIVLLGFEVRVELTNAATRAPFTAQITRGDAEALGLKEGDTVYVRATRVPEIPGSTELPKGDKADDDEALTKAVHATVRSATRHAAETSLGSHSRAES
jgi:sulfate/thiosulfate transport system ATP-binding protein